MKNDLLNIVVVKRDGNAAPFEISKIRVAITKAFIEVHGSDTASAMHKEIDATLERVVGAILRRGNGSVHIEDIQDMVELALMREDQLDVAKSYILFRKRQADKREAQAIPQPNSLRVKDGEKVYFLNDEDLTEMVAKSASGLNVDIAKVVKQARRDTYNDCSPSEVRRALIAASRTLIETEPDYEKLAARQLIGDLYVEVIGEKATAMHRKDQAILAFKTGIAEGIRYELLNADMANFDLELLANALVAERDDQFVLVGITTLYERYFIQNDKRRLEVPQGFFMRVAMGLALNEQDRNGRAIEFYNVLSSFDFMSSTPTLFNSGTRFSQLASCYLTTIPDDLGGIYDGIKENAMLQKFAGGVGNDWTRVRALGAHIKGTNGESQGTVPFLKVVNDTAVAVNQGGKRKGAVCAYLETWHLDMEEFLELRKNTGDDRRRTHDMNTANWIPDLFMKRVIDKGTWTLFSPNDCPDLHDLYGAEFERAYEGYEAKAKQGLIKLHRTVNAVDLWRKMLSMVFETGHPWITFKDPCNLRSPQRHVGVVHGSNLCTEITLNTSDDETAVCNLGSVNLANHFTNGVIDDAKLRVTITTAVRMLDNVIDLNYYSVEKARRSNMRHRPIGLGIMGFQDVLYAVNVSYDSDEAAELADRWQESVCYWAYNASADLAQERGAYETFQGSTWSLGILPQDTIEILEKARGRKIDVVRGGALDWEPLRAKVQRGMRNSNCTAIAPTATIGNIVGVTACIEPSFGNLSVKSNLNGEFTVVNSNLVNDLKVLGLWDGAMVVDLKHNDGSIQTIDRIPADIRAKYKTAFEIDPLRLIEAGARRQKWIDQAQSLNIYMSNATGKKLHDVYMAAWEKGLKTTYYLRTVSASQAEKSTVEAGSLNAVQSQAETPTFCRLDDPGCESCQ